MEANIIISALISWFLLAVVIGAVASTKGKEFGLWFFLSILLSPLVAGFCLVITLMPGKNSPDVSAKKDDFEEKWATILNYDEGTKKAVKQLEVYGSDAIDELKKVLHATNDPTRLPSVVDQIAKDFQIKKIEEEKRELAEKAAREIQDKIDAENEIAARAAREIKTKIYEEKKALWIKRGCYVLFCITVLVSLLLVLILIVPSENGSKIVDDNTAYDYNASGLSFIAKGEYDLAMKDFKYVSKGRYFGKINYIYAFVLKHERSTLYVLVLLPLIVIAILTYKNRTIRIKHYRYGLFVLLLLYLCYSPFVVTNEIKLSKHTAAIAAEREQREKTEREKAERADKEKAEREKIERAEREKIKVEKDKIAKRESILFKEAETYLNKGKSSRAKVLFAKLAKNGKDPEWQRLAQQALESLASNSVKSNNTSSSTAVHKPTVDPSQINNPNQNKINSSKEWSTPEALRAFGKPGDTVNPALLRR